jgi:hypothetical protein
LANDKADAVEARRTSGASLGGLLCDLRSLAIAPMLTPNSFPSSFSGASGQMIASDGELRQRSTMSGEVARYTGWSRSVVVVDDDDAGSARWYVERRKKPKLPYF